MNSVDIRVTSANWNGDEGATHFSFSDGSHGVQHFVKGGLGLTIGPLHNLSEQQHVAVVAYLDKANIGKGVL